MKLSSRTLYALRALFDITYHNGGLPTKVEAIAEREAVPARFLEQIFQDLKSARLVGSKRGPHGGYFLLRSADSVTLAEVLRAVGGGFEQAACCESGARGGEHDPLTSVCVTAAVWREAVSRFEAVLESVTLSDLCAKGAALGVLRVTDSGVSYVI